MPIPQPTTYEEKASFVARCMIDDAMKNEYKSIQQRYAVCVTIYDDKE